MGLVPDRFAHDSFVTGVGTFVGYGVILLAMFVVLFVVPYLIFQVL